MQTVRRTFVLFVVLSLATSSGFAAPSAKKAAAKPVQKIAVAPLPSPSADHFVVLFDGKDLTGWMNARGGAPGKGWIAADGVLTLDKPKDGGDIWTQHRFSNFILDLEFKTEGNSGIFVRTDKPTDNVQTGIEIQVERPAKTPDKHSVGAMYDALAPSKDTTKAGEWNHVVITCNKNMLTVVMNGEKIVEADLDKWTTPGMNPDGTKNKYRKAIKDFVREGHIGLQDHGAKVSYRNIKIKPLDEK